GLSVVIAWCVLALLLTALVLLNVLVIRKMQPVPKGAQNALELMVNGMHNWAKGNIGHAANFVGPVGMALMIYVFFNSIVELFGIPPPTEDINCTFAVGLCVFVTFNVAGFKYRGGLRGRIQGLSSPSPIVMPIRIITDLIAPCSMAIRLFANIMVGTIVMDLVYMVAPIILPAIVASYFNLFDAAIQTFVIGMLAIVYTSEAVE
ncbi:MAG: F0F1 ATP synthase subunit A, partial [Eubacteriales bacterium]|nr:F0F1 ATP synthase subunit A [Eubacteriales bacterium]